MKRVIKQPSMVKCPHITLDLYKYFSQPSPAKPARFLCTLEQCWEWMSKGLVRLPPPSSDWVGIPGWCQRPKKKWQCYDSETHLSVKGREVREEIRASELDNSIPPSTLVPSLEHCGLPPVPWREYPTRIAGLLVRSWDPPLFRRVPMRAPTKGGRSVSPSRYLSSVISNSPALLIFLIM